MPKQIIIGTPQRQGSRLVLGMVADSSVPVVFAQNVIPSDVGQTVLDISIFPDMSGVAVGTTIDTDGGQFEWSGTEFLYTPSHGDGGVLLGDQIERRGTFPNGVVVVATIEGRATFTTSGNGPIISLPPVRGCNWVSKPATVSIDFKYSNSDQDNLAHFNRRLPHGASAAPTQIVMMAYMLPSGNLVDYHSGTFVGSLPFTGYRSTETFEARVNGIDQTKAPEKLWSGTDGQAFRNSNNEIMGTLI